MRIGVPGAGFQGVCVALGLAGRGYEADLASEDRSSILRTLLILGAFVIAIARPGVAQEAAARSPAVTAGAELELYAELGALYGQGRIGELVGRVDRRLKETPDSPAAHFWYGKALESRGRLEDAEEAYAVALALVPDGPIFHAGMASVLEKQMARAGDPGAADAVKLGRVDGHWRQAIELDPEEPFYHAQYAGYLLAQRRYDAAVEEIGRAFALAPDDPEIQGIRGHIHLRAGAFAATVGNDPRKALSLLQPLTTGYIETADLHYFLGVAHRKLGDDEAARSHLQRCLELAPGQPEAWLELARLHLAAGGTADARAVLETALEKHGEHPAVRQLLRELDGAGDEEGTERPLAPSSSRGNGRKPVGDSGDAVELTALALHERLVQEAWRDGRGSEAEAALLARLADALGLGRPAARTVWDEARSRAAATLRGASSPERELTRLRAYLLTVLLARRGAGVTPAETALVRAVSRALEIGRDEHRKVLERLSAERAPR